MNCSGVHRSSINCRMTILGSRYRGFPWRFSSSTPDTESVLRFGCAPRNLDREKAEIKSTMSFCVERLAGASVGGLSDALGVFGVTFYLSFSSRDVRLAVISVVQGAFKLYDELPREALRISPLSRWKLVLDSVACVSARHDGDSPRRI